jgi:uncharacterized membrane protein HdeD (DUF308 family)
METQRKWWLVLIEGLIAIVIGLYMLIDQASASISFGLLLAAYLAIGGLVKAIKGGMRWNAPGGKIDTIQGLVGLIGGGGILLFYFLDILSLTVGVIILGIGLIIYGLLGLYKNFFDRGGAPFAWVPVFVNAALAAWGALIFFTRSQEINLTLWSGLILLLIGLVAAGYSFMLWKQGETASTA